MDPKTDPQATVPATARQARRIERLLRLQAWQMHTLITQVATLTGIMGPRDDQFRAEQRTVAEHSKTVTLATLQALQADESTERDPDLQTMIDTIKN